MGVPLKAVGHDHLPGAIIVTSHYLLPETNLLDISLT